MARTRSKRGTGSGNRPSRGSRRRKAHKSAATARLEPIILEGFATLPHELKVYIFQMACSVATSSAAIAANGADVCPQYPPPPLLDYDTALNLALGCKSYHGLIVPILYAQVWLNRPSSLASFQLALSTRPALGHLVRSLHVGPDDELFSWEPMQYREGYRCGCGGIHGVRPFMTTSVSSSKEAGLLPRWCQPGSSWAVDGPGPTSQSRAVFEAVRVAQDVLDVHIEMDERINSEGEAIQDVEWTVRVCEVQAAMDLYLLAVRRWEDLNGISVELSDEQSSISEENEEIEYPTLVLTGYSTTPEAVPVNNETIAFSRSDLLRHLARPHSLTDNFNHPLRFARAGLDLQSTGGYIPHQELMPAAQLSASDWTDAFCSFPSSFPDYSLPNTATIASVLATLRAILTYCPLIENLSLTGFLGRVICGSQSSGYALSKLRYLSLGPAPMQGAATIQSAAFAGLEELRICGTMLRTEVEDIFAKLPRLRRLGWSLAGKCSEDQLTTLQRSIALLTGRSETATAASADVQPRLHSSSSNRAFSTTDELDQPHSSNVNKASSLVVIKLMYCDLETILNKAPSPAVREALKLGRAVPGQRRRLQLGESHDWAIKPRSTLQEAYLGVRQWWGERCTGRRGTERD